MPISRIVLQSDISTGLTLTPATNLITVDTTWLDLAIGNHADVGAAFVLGAWDGINQELTMTRNDGTTQVISIPIAAAPPGTAPLPGIATNVRVGGEVDVLFDGISIGINGTNQLEVEPVFVQNIVTAMGIISPADGLATSIGAAGEVDVQADGVTIEVTGAVAGVGGTLNVVAGVFAPVAHGHALDDLTDVVITTPTAGQTLNYDGANWINGAAAVTTTAGDGIDITLGVVSTVNEAATMRHNAAGENSVIFGTNYIMTDGTGRLAVYTGVDIPV